MFQSEFLIAEKREGSDENTVILIVTAADLEQAKSAFRSELQADYQPTELPLWNGVDIDPREVEITFAQALLDVRRQVARRF